MGQEMKLEKKLNRIVRQINEIRKDVVILKLAARPQILKIVYSLPLPKLEIAKN